VKLRIVSGGEICYYYYYFGLGFSWSLVMGLREGEVRPEKVWCRKV